MKCGLPSAMLCAIPNVKLVQALHALALSNVQLCIPKGQPAAFVKRLAPYLKGSAADTSMDAEQRKRALREEAER